MKAFPVFLTSIISISSSVIFAQESASVRQMETAGDAAGARAALARAVETNPSSIPALTQYAEFLERYGDPAARQAYGKLLTAVNSSGDKERAGAIARRLALLDLLSGNSNAVSADLDSYRTATGKALALGAGAPAPAAQGTANIPGPLRSF